MSTEQTEEAPIEIKTRMNTWTRKEIASLKLAMSMFGDTNFKKIQKFLLQ